MPDEPESKRVPELPKTHVSAKAIRSVTKATVGSIPIAGAALSEIVENIIPDPDKVEERRWAGEVNECLDGLHGRIDGIEDRLTGRRTVTLDGVAASMLRLMLQRCPDGQASDLWTLEQFLAELPDIKPDAIHDAAGELQHYGLVEPLRAIGATIRIRLTDDAYALADKSVMGWDTREDAKFLAAAILKESAGIRTSDLQTTSGWPLRRFNPALRIVLERVTDGPVSAEVTPEHPTRHFTPSASDRFALKRLIEG